MNIKSTLLRWVLPLVAVVLFIFAARFIWQGKPQQTSVDAIQTPAKAPPNASAGVVAGSGVIQPSSELVAISTPVSGVVRSVNVAVGDEVKRGQILFVLDDREVQADLATRISSVNLAKKNVSIAEVDLAEKAASLKLYEAIDDKRAMIEDELTKRRFTLQSSAARLSAAQSTLLQVQAQMEQSKISADLRIIRSPLTATVLQMKIRPGEYAPATQLVEPLITLGATRPFHVKIDIDEADIGRMSQHGVATITARGAVNDSVQARFVRVEPLVVPKRSLTNAATERVDTRVLQVLYQLPDNAAGFYVGQQVDAFMPAIKTTKPATKASENLK